MFAEPSYREPEIGQVWYDRDHRVTFRFAKIVEIKDDGRIVIRRNQYGTGQRSTLGSKDSLRKRWRLLKETQ